MTLPASGPISISQVNVELGAAAETIRGLGDTAVRTLAGVPSGTISLAQLWAKSNLPTATVSPTTVAGSATRTGGSSTAALTVNTTAATVTANGGAGGYIYLWEFVSGTAATVNAPSSSSTTFARNLAPGSGVSGTTYSGVYRCKVTSNAVVTYSANVTVTTTHKWQSGS